MKTAPDNQNGPCPPSPVSLLRPAPFPSPSLWLALVNFEPNISRIYTPQLKSWVSLLRSTPMKIEQLVSSESSDAGRLPKKTQYSIQHTTKFWNQLVRYLGGNDFEYWTIEFYFEPKNTAHINLRICFDVTTPFMPKSSTIFYRQLFKIKTCVHFRSVSNIPHIRPSNHPETHCWSSDTLEPFTLPSFFLIQWRDSGIKKMLIIFKLYLYRTKFVVRANNNRVDVTLPSRSKRSIRHSYTQNYIRYNSL